MEIKGRTCLVCSCEDSMQLDVERLARASGARMPRLHRQLCGSERRHFEEALATGRPLLVACEQEAPLFQALAGTAFEGDNGRAADLRFVDLRDRAGWSRAGAEAGAKQAALLAAAALPVPDVGAIEMVCEGHCVVLAEAEDAEQALDLATRLATALDVTLVVSGTPVDVMPPAVRAVAIAQGRVVAASGHLGAFEIRVGEHALMRPSSRATLEFLAPAEEPVTLACDLILDLRAEPALFVAAEKRDGYAHVDPRDLLAVERALFATAQLTGTFEKPRYIEFREDLCAYSRSGRIGCTRCLNQCPTSAISPAGDHVAIDPFICAGCGSCSSICPSGAATYAAPPPDRLVERMGVLLSTYHAAGGEPPILLVYEERHGDPMFAAAARAGDGLPPHVLPLRVSELGQFGLEAMLAAMAMGAAHCLILTSYARLGDLIAVDLNVQITNAILAGMGHGPERIAFRAEDDPLQLVEGLWAMAPGEAIVRAGFVALGTKRDLSRLALDRLQAHAGSRDAVIPLPPEAPFGAVEVDTEGCTLCLACVGACPTGALIDNPDRPMLRFVEDACIQCGLCRNTCPERVIRLDPRLNLAPQAKSPVLIKEEEPFACVRCGKLFGTRSAIVKIVERLAGSHPMFQTAEQVARLEMCEDCRVIVQFERKDEPMRLGERPRPRTADDYRD